MRNGIDPEGFAECLARLRSKKGLSQKALAIEAKMDQSYVAGLESERRPPPRDAQLWRLARALGADQTEIAALIKARAISNFSKLGIAIDPPRKSALTDLVGIAADMTAGELGALNQIALILRSLRHSEQIEVLMKT